MGLMYARPGEADVTPSVEIFARYSELAREHGTELAEQFGYFYSAEWLPHFEQPNTSYLLVVDDGRVVAAAVCQRLDELDEPRPWIGHDVVTPFFGRLAAIAPPEGILPRDLFPMLLVTPPRSRSNILAVASDLSPSAREQAVRALLRGLREHAESFSASVVAFPAMDLDATNELTERAPESIAGFAFADFQLALPASFEEYLARLNAKRRKAARVELKAFEERGYEVEQKSVSDARAILTAHHEQNLCKYFVEYPQDLAAMIAREREDLSRLPDANATVFVGAKEGRAAASAVYLNADGVFHEIVAGLDHTVADPKAYTHFVVAYYEPIRAAIEAGLSRITVGGAAAPTKLLRGFRAVPRAFVLWPLSHGPWDLCREHVVRTTAQRITREVIFIMKFGGGEVQVQEDLGDALDFFEC